MIIEPSQVLRIDRRKPQDSRKGLFEELRQEVGGEVRFDSGTRGAYATGASNYRQMPIGVVLPRTVDEVIRTIEVCRRHDVPVLPRGGGTSLAGQCCNVAVVLDTSKYLNRVLAVDPEKRAARVQPGLILDALQESVGGSGLFFPPDPSTHAHCTLGGMIGNNSCGVHSVMGGKTVENTLELDVLLYDGTRMRVGETKEHEIAKVISEGGRRGDVYRRLRDLRNRHADLIRARFPKIPRRVSGFNLDELLPENGFNVARALVGTEGTCVTVLEATVRLWPAPAAKALLVLGYEDVYTAADQVPAILEAAPMALEGIDDRLVEDMRKKGMHESRLNFLPEGGGWLVVEFGGDTEQEADEKAQILMRSIRSPGEPQPSMKLYEDPRQEEQVWRIREAGLGATAFIPGAPPTWEGWEDAAVPPAALGSYLREFRGLLDRHGYGCSLYGHFGDGCVHTRIEFELTSAGGIAAYRSFVDEAADLVIAHGGSLSGEHGDGQSRAELLPKMFGPGLVQAFREFKAVWDPDNKMNPGKVVDPDPIVANLRLGRDWRPPPFRTHFALDQEGGWEGAALRCVGVGNCRNLGTATMCPSYMVTREEEHSTRGRARLLYEMVAGDSPVKDGWRDEAVKNALDLCLACKGCKNECPVNVDMATYKAEFLSHYYKRRMRPRAAYSLGLIMYASRAAARAPGIVNSISQHGLGGAVLKRLAGVDPRREIPPFARRTFRDWFTERRPGNVSGKRVTLFSDTFTNFFEPHIAVAATEILEAAGYQVTIPHRTVCCGRPLYDYGMLPLAKRMLREMLEVLHQPIIDGSPVIVLEPSCAAVLRDELGSLLPNDAHAKRLGDQTFTLSEFLHDEGYEPIPIPRHALVQKHCHHEAIMKFDAEEELLAKTIDAEILASGCCGMAGSFGFEEGLKYEVSVRAGERVLLPRVREADNRTLIVADGFSCREQIRQQTGRRGLHLAEVLHMALPTYEELPHESERRST